MVYHTILFINTRATYITCLIPTKKHSYKNLSKNLGSLYNAGHKSYSDRMYTEKAKKQDKNYRILFKTSGASPFRIKDPGHRTLLKEAEELRREEKLYTQDSKRLGKDKQNKIVNLARRRIKPDTRKE